MLKVSQVDTPLETEQVRELLREYTTWALSLTAFSDQAPTFQGLERELATLPGIYAPPTGCLLIATHNDLPAGSIALKGHEAGTAEIKRLYVRPAFRGLNIGPQLVATVIAEARKLGYRRLILDSHMSMTKAHAIYAEAGFRTVRAPDDFPEMLKPIAVFMEMEL